MNTGMSFFQILHLQLVKMNHLGIVCKTPVQLTTTRQHLHLDHILFIKRFP